ncbi:ABC transporter ATP-binding protein [Tsukamurella ocularis]|uniref:ABC transporter ATP-binding protein n=1 Tax=Tsukamurella ocularis TaxID=1970234 RepID=UPI002169196D|nr:ABC transporter ATP-binding protein [Tsukamurella ocularis]MCS3778783.1 iron complex transport system ATP-binding protein [Tsukamurella ocularis]MCS3789484.1 iron complex transport system ATP-binding protein [Tsukamurella ocularis]MCS3851466.1 iron complex transport system ATP-binding protein [Tsukamurella ocularis]
MRIELDRITVEIGGTRVLHDISLDIAAGAHVGLIGPNGSGKSTLLRCLYRAIAPASGTVRVGGRDLAAMRRRDGARLVSAVTQSETGHLGFTAEETVMLGRFAHGDAGSAAAIGACEAALVAVDATALRRRSVLGLSGGERQRVLIARALAQDTPVLLLDEPLNHLDVRHQLDLLRLLRATTKTTVTAIHDIDLAAQSCDRLVLLDRGRVVATGTPGEVLTADRIDEVYGVRPVIAAAGTGPPRIRFEL